MAVLHVSTDEPNQSTVSRKHLGLPLSFDAADQFGPARKHFHRHLEFALLRAVIVSDSDTGSGIRTVQRLSSVKINQLDKEVLIVLDGVVVDDGNLDDTEFVASGESEHCVDWLIVFTGLRSAVDCSNADGAWKPMFILDEYLEDAAALGAHVVEAGEAERVVILLIPVVNVAIEQFAKLPDRAESIPLGGVADIPASKGSQSDLCCHPVISRLRFLQSCDGQVAE